MAAAWRRRRAARPPSRASPRCRGLAGGCRAPRRRGCGVQGCGPASAAAACWLCAPAAHLDGSGLDAGFDAGCVVTTALALLKVCNIQGQAARQGRQTADCKSWGVLCQAGRDLIRQDIIILRPSTCSAMARASAMRSESALCCLAGVAACCGSVVAGSEVTRGALRAGVVAATLAAAAIGAGSAAGPAAAAAGAGDGVAAAAGSSAVARALRSAVSASCGCCGLAGSDSATAGAVTAAPGLSAMPVSTADPAAAGAAAARAGCCSAGAAGGCCCCWNCSSTCMRLAMMSTFLTFACSRRQEPLQLGCCMHDALELPHNETPQALGALLQAGSRVAACQRLPACTFCVHGAQGTKGGTFVPASFASFCSSGRFMFCRRAAACSCGKARRASMLAVQKLSPSLTTLNTRSRSHHNLVASERSLCSRLLQQPCH